MAGIFDVKENVALKDKNTFHVAATTRWYGEFSSADDLRFTTIPVFGRCRNLFWEAAPTCSLRRILTD